MYYYSVGSTVVEVGKRSGSNKEGADNNSC
jgi:hypothetical protein